ncbi:MAG: hypothetical protein ACI4DQ_06720, partial [Lachnospiraceae bacterium]
ALKVDNADVSVMSSYTFTRVTADHIIAVTFKQKDTPVQSMQVLLMTLHCQAAQIRRMMYPRPEAAHRLYGCSFWQAFQERD